MSRSRRVVLLLVIVLVAVFLAYRTAAVINAPIDRSFVTERPCAPPCWYGLEIDKSTKADVYATLKKLSFVDQGSIQELRTTWLDRPAEQIDFFCAQSGEYCGGATISENKLKRILLVVRYDLTFGMAVQQLGAPKYLMLSPYHPMVGGSDVSLVWPDKAIMVRHVDEHSDALYRSLASGTRVPSNTEVTDISYVSKEALNDKLGDCCSYIPWPGFE